MLIISGTGVGAVIAGGWCLFDNGYGVYQYINNNGFTTYSDKLDRDFANQYGKIELWNGIN